MVLYHGIVLVRDLYHGIILQNYITRLYYGIILREYIMEYITDLRIRISIRIRRLTGKKRPDFVAEPLA